MEWYTANETIRAPRESDSCLYIWERLPCRWDIGNTIITSGFSVDPQLRTRHEWIYSQLGLRTGCGDPNCGSSWLRKDEQVVKWEIGRQGSCLANTIQPSHSNPSCMRIIKSTRLGFVFESIKLDNHGSGNYINKAMVTATETVFPSQRIYACFDLALDAREVNAYESRFEERCLQGGPKVPLHCISMQTSEQLFLNFVNPQ